MLGMSDKEYKKILDKSKKQKEAHKKAFIKVLKPTLLIGIGILTLVALSSLRTTKLPVNPIQQASDSVQQTTYQKPKFQLDSRIISLADQIGINRDDLVKAKTQIVPPQDCGTIGNKAASCFDGESILIYDNIFTEPIDEQRSTLAHEYLHWVWEYKLSNSERSALIDQIRVVYNKNSTAFAPRFQSYFSGGTQPYSDEFFNEWHSIIGTEIADWRIPEPLLTHYKTYLPNRNALPSYY